MSSNDNSYKWFWLTTTIILIGIIVSYNYWPEFEPPEPISCMMNEATLMSMKNGWIIADDIATEGTTIKFGPKVIYVTTLVDEHPSCQGCHSKNEIIRRLNKNMRCPTWIITSERLNDE